MGRPLSLAAAQLQESARLIAQLTKQGVNLLEDGLENRLDDKKILEVSTSRIFQHFENNEFAIITSWRQPDTSGAETPEEAQAIIEQTERENEENYMQIRKTVQGAGLGHIRLAGYGMEEVPGGGMQEVVEKSLLVPNQSFETGKPLPGTDFFYLMVSIARTYDQWGIVWHSPESGSYLVQVKEETVVQDHMSNFGTAVRQYYSQVARHTGSGEPKTGRMGKDPDIGKFSLHDPQRSKFDRRESFELRYLMFAEKPTTLLESWSLHLLGDVGVLFYEGRTAAMADIVAEALELGN